MTDDLDLSGLTDDQLVALAQLVAAELGRRSAAVQAAAHAAVLSETEKARIAKQAAEAEAARLRTAERERIREEAQREVRRAAGMDAGAKAQKEWGHNRTIGLMVVETLGPGWHCEIWMRDEERRVYLDGPGREKVTYQVAGARRPPGSIELKGFETRPDRDRIKAICRYAANRWNRHPTFSCDEAADATVKSEPFPDDYLETRSAA